MPRNERHKKIKRLERELLANIRLMALLEDQARRQADGRARARAQDPLSELKDAIASASKVRLN